MNADGGVTAASATGLPVFTVAAPWAKDANGADVPTYYRLEGTTIVQVVSHQAATYPVTADPSVKFDCSWTYVTCSFYLSRSLVKSIWNEIDRWTNTSLAAMAAAGAKLCAPAGPEGSIACGAAFAIGSSLVLDQFRWAATHNQCIRLRILNPIWFPIASLTPLVYTDNSSWCSN
jgi:hypothetical protein